MASHERLVAGTRELCEQFYRCLLVQHVLQYVRRHAQQTSFSKRISRDAARYSFKTTRTTWHKFLDGLSLLCDHAKGGETVTAIAVEKSALIGSCATFWIAVNEHSYDAPAGVRAYGHLSYLLRNLDQIARDGRDVEATSHEILRLTVDKAKDRVNNYRKKLQSLIATAKKRKSASLETGTLHIGQNGRHGRR